MSTRCRIHWSTNRILLKEDNGHRTDKTCTHSKTKKPETPPFLFETPLRTYSRFNREKKKKAIQKRESKVAKSQTKVGAKKLKEIDWAEIESYPLAYEVNKKKDDTENFESSLSGRTPEMPGKFFENEAETVSESPRVDRVDSNAADSFDYREEAGERVGSVTEGDMPEFLGVPIIFVKELDINNLSPIATNEKKSKNIFKQKKIAGPLTSTPFSTEDSSFLPTDTDTSSKENPIPSGKRKLFAEYNPSLVSDSGYKEHTSSTLSLDQVSKKTLDSALDLPPAETKGIMTGIQSQVLSEQVQLGETSGSRPEVVNDSQDLIKEFLKDLFKKFCKSTQEVSLQYVNTIKQAHLDSLGSLKKEISDVNAQMKPVNSVDLSTKEESTTYLTKCLEVEHETENRTKHLKEAMTRLSDEPEKRLRDLYEKEHQKYANAVLKAERRYMEKLEQVVLNEVSNSLGSFISSVNF